MRLLADLHTHTVSSGHGFSTVTEIAHQAQRIGLELVAVTDHGPTCPGGPHPWHFWNLKVVPSVMGGVRVLKGVEANPSELYDNGIDLPDLILDKLDLVAVGFHPMTGYDDKDAHRNTEVMVRAMSNPNVDLVTHPGNLVEFPVDVDAILEAAITYNVILELNDHSFEPTGSRGESADGEREFARRAREAGVPVSIGSDAHYHTRVGRFEHALAIAAELGFTESDVINRDAASVLAFLTGKRDRPRLDVGGVEEQPW